MVFKTNRNTGNVFNDNKKRSDAHHGSVKPESGVKSKGMIKNTDYASGIEIMDSYPLRNSKLGKDEYFALMVTDIENKGKRPRSDYVDFEKGYIGFERTGNKIYVSKDFNKRNDLYRGKTVIVKVYPEASIREL